MKERQKSSTISKVGVFAASLFVTATAVYFYSPTFGSHADSSRSAEVNLTIGSALALSTSSDSLALEANVGDFVHGNIDVDVVTNSQYGYTLTLEDSDDDSSLIQLNSSVSDKLTSEFEGAKTGTAMDNNTWGFSLDATDYYYVPTFGNPVALKRTVSAVTGDYDRTTVDFGAKVGMSLTAGTYTDVVKFTVYVNGADNNPEDGTEVGDPGVVPAPGTIHSITYMQDMTSAICNATTTPIKAARTFDWDGSYSVNQRYVPRARLIDARDGKTYLVSKLADGNCWMSQNLALDLTANTAIIASNNDGTTTLVTPNNTTQTTADVIWPQADDNWRSYKPQASESYFKNGMSMSSTPTGTNNTYDWEKTGNYYNWYAATAGTGDSALVDIETSSSICPKGWRLPSNSGTNSYFNLVKTVYGLNTGSITVAQTLRSAPLNFLMAGEYNYERGYMTNQGTRSNHWSSSGYVRAASAHIFYFDLSTLTPQGSNYKGNGYTVRCVAIRND